jgi:ABC-type dipeptide/oligopeptide/nickel transport system ATPase component
LEQRHQNTCRWLLDGGDYHTWRKTPNSFFWLHGLSGCGKTILASSIIQQLHSENSGGLIACHYFDINGGDKRDLSQMLRSLLCQVSSKHPEVRKILQASHVAFGMGAKRPTVTQLSEQFTSILDQVAEVTVVIDALDESDSQDDIVSWIKGLQQKDRNSLHLLVTSRKQGILATAIEKWLKPDQLHAVQIDEINKDIADYIHARLFESKEFEKWNPHKGLQEEVEKAVLQRANGM